MDAQIVEWATRAEAVWLLYALVALLAVGNLWLAWRWRAFQRRWRQLLSVPEGGSLEHALYETLRRVAQIEATLQAHGNHLQQLQSQTDRCLQKVGILRYDAFPDVGGHQSFAVALLNQHGDGIVLSGIHSRQEMRVYAKPLQGGNSPIGLSTEEQQAIREASSRR